MFLLVFFFSANSGLFLLWILPSTLDLLANNLSWDLHGISYKVTEIFFPQSTSVYSWQGGFSHIIWWEFPAILSRWIIMAIVFPELFTCQGSKTSCRTWWLGASECRQNIFLGGFSFSKHSSVGILFCLESNT